MFVVRTLTLSGIEALPLTITATVNAESGAPDITTEGLDPKSESTRMLKATVRAGFVRMGLEVPPMKLRFEGGMSTWVEALPAFVAAFGLAMGLAPFDGYVLGALELSGKVSHVRGILPMLRAIPSGTEVLVPDACAAEAAHAHLANGPALQVFVARTVAEVVGFLTVGGPRHGVKPRAFAPAPSEPTTIHPDFAPVVEAAVEAAKKSGGAAPIVLWETVGVKSVYQLARAVVAALGPLTEAEAIEVSCLYSVGGLMPETGLVTARPFRAPHQTCNAAAMLGGGAPVRPGELSLAHCGVLYLDDLAEFGAATSEGLRYRLRANEGTVTMCRTRDGAPRYTTFPARPVVVIGRSNKCPCGSLYGACTCSAERCARYHARSAWARNLAGGSFDVRAESVRFVGQDG